ncbi:DUF4265 domain-containing protein [Streptomyces mirabilis]
MQRSQETFDVTRPGRPDGFPYPFHSQPGGLISWSHDYCGDEHFFLPGAARQSVINAFQELGVDGEGIERFGMVALDVPPAADVAKVQRLLNHGVSEEWWDMEEECITAH